MLDGKEVDVETALEEARRLGRKSIILFAIGGAFAFANLLIGFHPAVKATPWLDTLLVRIDAIVVLGLIGIAVTFTLLAFYIWYSINNKGIALVFSLREKLAYAMIIWLVLGVTVVSILWYQWGPNFI